MILGRVEEDGMVVALAPFQQRADSRKRRPALSEIEKPEPDYAEALAPECRHASLWAQFRPAIVGVVLLTLLTGAAFSSALAVLARAFFPRQADGSLIERGGIVVGSELIGQNFSQAGYFHSRPSAAGDGYDATASGGSNLGPANPKLRDAVAKRADEFGRSNGLPPEAVVPIDAVTCSASGLDPHISPANAALQIGRVARARHLSEDAVRRLVAEYTSGPQFGFLGEPRVAVLPLNMALDRLAPLAPMSANPPDR